MQLSRKSSRNLSTAVVCCNAVEHGVVKAVLDAETLTTAGRSANIVRYFPILYTKKKGSNNFFSLKKMNKLSTKGEKRHRNF